MKRVDDKELAAVLAMNAPDRYAFFIRRVADWEEVWSLRSAQGWVLTSDEAGHQCVPVWPHSRFAEACEAVLGGTEPAPIPLQRWLEAWTQGMARDGRKVAVFPTPEGKGVVVTPEQLREDLLEECKQYE